MNKMIQFQAARWVSGEIEAYEAWVNPEWVSCVEFRGKKAFITVGTNISENGTEGGSYSDQVMLVDEAEIAKLREFLKGGMA